jgi:putative acetyltransferase
MSTLKQEIIFKSVYPTDKDVIKLIEKLNQYQIALYRIEDCTLESPESLQNNHAFMIGAFSNNILVGIGAVKLLDTYAEIKRMYVDEQYRGLSIAENILQKLEVYSKQNNIETIRLETGNKHFAALRLYKKSGYYEIERFGNYKTNGISVFFEKQLH